MADDPNDLDPQSVWVFVGRGQFPSGVFSTRARAEAWIGTHGLSGTLTWYPIDVGTFEWALSKGHFTPKRDDQRSAAFIARFSSATQPHHHYDAGKRLT